MWKRANHHRVLWLTIAILVLAIVAGAGVVQAQNSEHYRLMINTVAGGNYGGQVLSSTSYTLTVSTGSHIQVSTTSSGYELCTGFVCQSTSSYFQLRLPTLQSNPE